MAITSIKRKHCKCKECQGNLEKAKWPTLSCWGYFYAHLPEDLAKEAGTKRKVQIKNQNARKAISVKLRHDVREKVEYSEETVKEAWFKARRREMIGYCQEEGCRNRTNKESDTYFRWSICHIVPKSLVPSVAYHPLNWVELCQEHHQEFDNTFLRAAKMKIFLEARKKFEQFQYLIPAHELRKVNPYLL